MSIMHKAKQYFGLTELDGYEDDYIDEPARPRARVARDPYAEVDHYADDYRRDAYDDGYEPRRRPEPVMARAAAPAPRTNGALAMDAAPQSRRAPMFDEGGPLSKITTLCPRDYSEARTIGERFREGNPVIMDLVEMTNADAKRLVDFAAGLAFALHGSFDKVAAKVFLLSPANVDVSAEERRRIVAQKGFYSQN
ncbi:MAG: cell division protein SepF [Nocardiaceae bacterium]|nr:cell division protein SepF [Nocardiaceae bacterium]